MGWKGEIGQGLDGGDGGERISLSSGVLQISVHPAKRAAGGGPVGAEFTGARGDGLSSSERVGHFASNRANRNAKMPGPAEKNGSSAQADLVSRVRFPIESRNKFCFE